MEVVRSDLWRDIHRHLDGCLRPDLPGIGILQGWNIRYQCSAVERRGGFFTAYRRFRTAGFLRLHHSVRVLPDTFFRCSGRYTGLDGGLPDDPPDENSFRGIH